MELRTAARRWAKSLSPREKLCLQWWSSTLETQENLLVPVAVLEAERNNLKGFPGKSRSLTPLEN